MAPFCSLLFLVIAISVAQSEAQTMAIGNFGLPFDTTKCNLPKTVLTEIQGYQGIANEIFSTATQKSFKGKTYSKLEYITDTFGPRPSGSLALEAVLDYILEQLKEQGLANVREEKVDVPKVIRGDQYCFMLKPRVQRLSVVATGFSTSTSELGIQARIILITSEEFFMANKGQVQGKIAVIDYVIQDLDDIFTLIEGAGAVGILYRSYVSFSIYSKAQRAGQRFIGIPVAFLNNEDVDLFGRLTKRGFKIKIHLMLINTVIMTKSRNIMAELPGKLNPEELVLVSGHADSWHYSEGAQDDGIGIALTLEIMKLFKKLKLIPKRTVRPVIWTTEELGFFGSAAYLRTHGSELARHSAMLEADLGCFKPVGFIFGNVSIQFGCILNEIMKLQQKTIGAEYLHTGEANYLDISTDVLNFVELGIPAANLNGDAGRYFWYHHTKADTMSIVNSGQLDRCLAFMATTAYILADLENMVPRN